MNKKDDRRARMYITEVIDNYNNYSGDPSWKDIHFFINRDIVFTKYYIDKDFIREWREWFEKTPYLHFMGEYEGITYRRLKHNLKELRKANIKLSVMTDIEY